MCTTAELMGGVGNQLFQIAAAYAVSRELNTDLKFVKHQFSGCRQGSHPATYYTTLYEKLNFVDSLPDAFVLNEREWTYNPIDEYAKLIFNVSPVVKLSGYFQSELYFKKYSREIKELFTPSIGIKTYLKTHTDLFSKFPELEHDNDYCFIGVRRGDYIKYAHVHNPCGMTYYNAAIKKLNKERYYIVSDDMAWCKENFKGDRFRFIQLSSDTDELFASTLFKNYIISNSSFQWWGSFLSVYDAVDVRIVAPDKWIFGSDAPREKYWSIYRDEMTVIERPVETH